ncbi:MAG: hypothetical protein VX438_01750, partial [Planctomycetota bacterium]|nr:hypothetical protein [Planctomycetota bacterium]
MFQRQANKLSNHGLDANTNLRLVPSKRNTRLDLSILFYRTTADGQFRIKTFSIIFSVGIIKIL